MVKVFVTGGSGFVGGAVIEALAGAHEVLAMARSDNAGAVVADRGATPVRCTLGDVTPGDIAGCELVVHCAAVTDEWAPSGVYEEVNTQGTAHMVRAAREAGVRRFVHVSSDSALFDGRPLRAMNEGMPLAVDSPFGYARSKARAEEVALAANDPAGGFDTVAVRPTLVWGPGDRTVLPQLAELVERGGFVWLSGGRSEISTTHIANLVHGISLVINTGRPGSAYFIADAETHLLRSFLSSYAAAAGLDLPSRSVPAWAARAVAAVVEPAWGWARPSSPPPISRFAVALLSTDLVVRSSKAATELGYAPVLDSAAGLATIERVRR